MPDLEKVIKGLECIISSGNAGMRDDCVNCIYPGGGDCLVPALRNALTLLKEQEPMEPVYELGITRCGQCNHEIDKYGGDNYCPQCGRAVKWE